MSAPFRSHPAPQLSEAMDENEVRVSSKSKVQSMRDDLSLALDFYFVSRKGQVHWSHLLLEIVDAASTVFLAIAPLVGFASSIRASIASIAAALLTLVPCMQSDAVFYQRKSRVAAAKFGEIDIAVLIRMLVARGVCFAFVFSEGTWIPIVFALYGSYDLCIVCFFLVRQLLFFRRSPLGPSSRWTSFFYFCMFFLSFTSPFGYAFTLATITDPLVAAALTISCKASASSTTRLLLCSIGHLNRRLWFCYMPVFLLLLAVVSTTSSNWAALCMAVTTFCWTKADWLINLVHLAKAKEDEVFSGFMRVHRWYHVLWTLHDYGPRPKAPVNEELKTRLIKV